MHSNRRVQSPVANSMVTSVSCGCILPASLKPFGDEPHPLNNARTMAAR
jgi:hypothetical protein